VALATRPHGPVIAHAPGPPAHAPAHGYRRKHQNGAELRYDTGLGVYVVVGHTEVYFHDGLFVRIRSGVWQVSAKIGGPWQPRDTGWVPPGLRSKHHAKKSKNRGRGPAKAAK
jgi:hypothetical protein